MKEGSPISVVAFVLVSWRPDAPAGMERAVAAHAAGLVAAGHRAVILTAEPDTPRTYRGAVVESLTSLRLLSPCDDETLRSTIDTAADRVRGELAVILARHQVDVVIYVDALWGLGRITVPTPGVRQILAVHVVGHDIDLHAALQAADAVIAPSPVVIHRAAARGYDTSGWQVVPNSLLLDPPPPDASARRELGERGPIRALARLGPEKGICGLLEAASTTRVSRRVEIALGLAGFETTAGIQDRLFEQCERLATAAGVAVRPGLRWTQAPDWLAMASIVMVPSLRESFGLVAIEAMAAGTPVVAFAVDNLPDLIGSGGIVVPVEKGPIGLWRAAEEFLADPVTYAATSRAGYYRSRDYRPALVADLLLKVVS